MTFIVGIKCTNGLVLATDSLETDGIKRRFRRKIEFTRGTGWEMGWGAASNNADIIDRFSQELRDNLRSVPFDIHKIQDATESALLLIQRKYKKRMDVVFGLIGSGVLKNGEPVVPDIRLYRATSESCCLSPEKQYCCAGMDDSLAEMILDNTFYQFIQASEAIRLVVFLTNVMKEYADGVGKNTHVFFATHASGKWTPLLDRQVRGIERTFKLAAFQSLISRYWNEKQSKYSKEWMDEQTDAQMQRAKQLTSQKCQLR